MDNFSTELIKKELDEEVSGKGEWLKYLYESILKFSEEIERFSQVSDSNFYPGLFLSLSGLSDSISSLSNFILNFSSDLRKIHDSLLVSLT